MTEEEKRRQQQEQEGAISGRVTRGLTDGTSPAAEQTGEQKTEQREGQTEIKSGSGTTLGKRTSTGTILNYDPGADQAYQNALAALEEVQNNAPVYTDSYGSDLSALYDRIVNRSPFRYDINGDPLYQQYKDQYLKGGNLAMRDTMGQAAGLTGGYGSTYSQRAGQQAYDAYVQQLNAVIPQLYNDAYGRWSDEGNELYRQYGLLGDRRDDEYGRYQDDYNRWMQRVQYARDDADTAYERGLGDWQREYSATMDKAEMLADTGDFSVYAELYGQGAANNLFRTWELQNPLLAYQSGYITPDEYKSITGSYPPGYKAPGSGGRYSVPTPEPESGGTTGSAYSNKASAVAESGKELIQQGYSYTEVQGMIKAAADAGEITANDAQTAWNIIQQDAVNKTTVGGRH